MVLLARGAAAILLAIVVPAGALIDPVPPEQVIDGHFDQGGLAWSWYGPLTAGVTGGQLCADVNAGLANPWDAGIVQNLPLLAGSSYTLSFRAQSSVASPIRVTVQLGQAPYTPELDQMVSVGAAPDTFSYTFTSSLTADNGQLAFQIGGAGAQRSLCLDDVSLTGGSAVPAYVPDTGPRVRVNQVGYLPSGPKRATVVTDSAAPVAWQLRTAAGTVAASGTAVPAGVDEASGQQVQSIDFGRFTRPGTGYTLAADGQVSYPFDISPDVYNGLRADALQFFYLQRSGIAIDGTLVGAQYARPAGHLGVAPNTGDINVPCQPGLCDYRLDVRGGWYDAGDQGKYVVNTGITAYQLMSIFERTKYAVTGRFGSALADGSLRVPEHGNGAPDVLDEARWGIEFLLRMQVPAGQPLAGMAHSKVQDRAWTDLPMMPNADPQPRELHAPTTAATLDLAAVGAQCARVFAPYDAAFAQRCLASARTAYAAAKAHPNYFADPADDIGGGSYADNDATDEQYWAAAELYLTTGAGEYLTDLTASPHHTSAAVFDPTGFGWLHTAALGRLDLATLPSALPDRQRVRQSVLDAADQYATLADGQAYGLPLPGASWAYFWGSNSNIVNNVVVLATAYDMTGDARYREHALSGMDYVFGRNALNHSYVTGWGDKTPQTLHHRWYGPQFNPSLPPAPAGTLVGGANTQATDPVALRLLRGCEPQMCYIDDNQSFSTNEPSINYGAALSWMASFLADQGASETPRPAANACRVTYDTASAGSGGGFTARMSVTNKGTTALKGWTLRFAFTGDQRVQLMSQGRPSQSGPVVEVRNEPGNATIAPGQTVSLGFTGTVMPSYPNATPALFTVNGTACTG